jgi:micrococcal nuclease
MQKKDILFFILATILFIICLLISINSYATTIDRVVDGDTFIVNNPNPPLDMLQKSHRLAGIDTPESFKQVAKCQKEIELGLKAKEFTKNFTKGEVDIVYLELDKYGRYLVNVDKNGLNLADELVRNGLAVFYDGGTKTKDWCK